ncbi:MAG: hypothetical protein ABIQ16_19045 [Polyangiaceae bacterium]
MRSELICLGLILATGCSGSIDVGPGNAAGAPGNAAGAPGNAAGSGNTAPGALACTDATPLPSWPATSGCTSGADLPIVGTWHGYVENQVAPWDDLTLVVNGASVAGGLCGTLTIGTGTPPPPATDPNVGYPDPSETTWQEKSARILPGFVLSLLNGTTDGARVRFSVGRTEPWKGWCGLQTSYKGDTGSSCNCLPNWSIEGDSNCTLFDPSGGQDLVVNCAKAALCASIGGVCQCNDSACTATVTASTDFDLRFAGDEAEGNATSVLGARTHFVRVP